MEKDYKILKKQALHLRKQGDSYGDIVKKLNISKSTASYWLHNVPLTPEQRAKYYTKQIQILSLGPNSQKERRAREIEQIVRKAEQEIIFPLPFETFRLMGAALYWGEGGKGKMAHITNADPHLILFAVKWIESVFRIPPVQLKASLNIYPQQKELDIKKFWSDLTKIPLENFCKSYIKPLSKNYKKNNLYYGTIRIYIPKSANLRHQIFGWIKAATKNIAPDVQLTQRKWESIAKTPRPVNL